MDAASSLFERARDALRRHDPDRADELERAWRREPWQIGLGDEDPHARAELLDAMCGERLFDGAPRTAAVRVRRGERIRFRAVRDDGSSEEHALAMPADELRVLAARQAAARSDLADREQALVHVSERLPAIVRRRPAWWQIWLWPIYAVLAWLHRVRVAEVEDAHAADEAARSALADVVRETEAAEQRAQQVRARYRASLCALAAAPSTRELAIEVDAGPLPAGVDVRELAADTRARDTVDAVVLAGDAATKLGALVEVARRGRAATLAGRAHAALEAAASAADQQLARAEDEQRARLGRLEAMRIGDADGLVQTVRARLRPSIVGSVHALIEHAQVHLGSELAELSREWIESIAHCHDGDTLAATVGRIETSAPNVTQRIADEVRLLVSNGIAGIGHDIYPQLVAALQPYGLPEPPRGSRVKIAPIAILPSLGGAEARLQGALHKLTDLFRSFESRKGEVREKAHARLEHVREVANAELLDCEPRAHDAISEAARAELVALVAKQAQWLARALAEEQSTVAREREGLAAVVATRDAARRDADAIAGELARLVGR